MTSAAIVESLPHAAATRYDFERPLGVPDAAWSVRAVDCRQRQVVEVEGLADVEPAVAALLAHDWMVSRWVPGGLIRAWRGDNLPTTRMDFHLDAETGRWRIRKFRQGWTATTEPSQDYLAPEGWDLSEAEDWCRSFEDLGLGHPDFWYFQRVGANFARAWRGQRVPVYNAGQVLRRRREVEAWVAYLRSVGTRDEMPVVERPAWVPVDVPADDVLKAVTQRRGKIDLAYLL